MVERYGWNPRWEKARRFISLFQTKETSKMAETSTRPIEILLVEDSAADVRLTVEALKEAKVRNKLNVVDDGVKALAYLNKKGEYAMLRVPI